MRGGRPEGERVSARATVPRGLNGSQGFEVVVRVGRGERPGLTWPSPRPIACVCFSTALGSSWWYAIVSRSNEIVSSANVSAAVSTSKASASAS